MIHKLTVASTPLKLQTVFMYTFHLRNSIQNFCVNTLRSAYHPEVLTQCPSQTKVKRVSSGVADKPSRLFYDEGATGMVLC